MAVYHYNPYLARFVAEQAPIELLNSERHKQLGKVFKASFRANKEVYMELRQTEQTDRLKQELALLKTAYDFLMGQLDADKKQHKSL